MCDGENKIIIMHIWERETGWKRKKKKKEKEKIHTVAMFKIVTGM